MHECSTKVEITIFHGHVFDGYINDYMMDEWSVLIMIIYSELHLWFKILTNTSLYWPQ